jgi:NADH-quinone oxidoreductase subunit J
MTLFYQFVFYLFALVAVGSALLFVTRRNPVAAALWLVNVMVSLAALYIMMGAHFVGAVQVLIYAGAIMVVFLFVVMLLNLGHGEAVADIRSMRWRLAAGALGIVMLAFLLASIRDPLPLAADPAFRAPATAAELEVAPVAQPVNAVASVSEYLFRDYLLAFEAASFVLLAAIVGAVALAKRSSTRG